MVMIRGANDQRVNVFLFDHFAPVRVRFGIGKFFGAKGQMVVVDVAKGDDIFAGDRAEMRFTSAPRADERDIQFVARSVRAENFDARKN